MRFQKGFTLIETLVASAVLLIFIAAVFTIISLILQSLGEARMRSMAIQIAQDKIELARNLSYERLGTTGGIPAGDLVAHDVVTKLEAEYIVDTVVLFIDDSFDGKAPADLLPTDYKRVRVNVSWRGAFTSKKPVVLIADVTPPGLEQDNNGGTISILVFNSQGLPVPTASVHIEAPMLSPPVMIDTYTDIYGTVIIPGAPICDACYQINVSKEGYSSEKTYSRGEIANPINPHLSVLKGKVSEVSLAIDQLATLSIKATRSQQSGYSPFAGANVVIQGSKEIGRTVDDEPVYKTTKSITTGTGGVISILNLEWDRYSVSVPSNSSLDFAGSWPLNPIAVNPGQTTSMEIIVEAASDHSYLVQLEDESHQPLTAAFAQLKREGFIATDSAGLANRGDWSQAYFKNFVPGVYELSLFAEGYESATTSVVLSGDKQERFMLLKAVTP